MKKLVQCGMAILAAGVFLTLLLIGCGKEAAYGNRPVSAWRKDLKDPDPQVRREAAEALGEIGAKAKAAVPDLGEALNDPDDRVRIKVSLALWSIGASVKGAVPNLIAALNDRNAEVRLNVAGALGFLNSE